jgi:hypothetical protein
MIIAKIWKNKKCSKPPTSNNNKMRRSMVNNMIEHNEIYCSMVIFHLSMFDEQWDRNNNMIANDGI